MKIRPELIAEVLREPKRISIAETISEGVARSEACAWAKDLELAIPPWVVTGDFDMFDMSRMTVDFGPGKPGEMRAAVHAPLKRERIEASPLWVVASWFDAHDRGHTAERYGRYDILWKAWLLLLAHDRALRAQIESVLALGTIEQAVAYVHESFDLLMTKLADAPAMRVLEERQAMRDRRISGRPGPTGDSPVRPSDAAFLREALPPLGADHHPMCRCHTCRS